MIAGCFAAGRRRPGRALTVPVVAALLFVLAIPASAIAVHEPRYTCQASALRIDTSGPLNPLTPAPIEPFVANPGGTGPNGVCRDDDTDLVERIAGENAALPGGLGTVQVLFAETDARENGGFARAGVVDLALNAPAPIGTVGVEVLTSRATSGCSPQGQAQLAGATTIAAVEIQGQRIEVNAPQPVTITVPGGVLVIEIAKQTRTADTITQQGVVITASDPAGNQLAQVVIAEAIADVHDCRPPCPAGSTRAHDGPFAGQCVRQCPGGGPVLPVDQPCPAPPRRKCNAGAGNGSEPTNSGECDPGGSTGRNRGGD